MSHHLLPVKHFHLIFTLPHELKDLIFYNKRHLYNLLFEVAAKTIQTILGGKIGMVATLHSWGSNLAFHPHLHVIVAAGSWQQEQWKASYPRNPNCFCPATQLRETYKALFLKRLLEVIELEELNWGKDTIEAEGLFCKVRRIYHTIQRKKWTVRIENPVLGVEQIITYLARYVRRVALTNSRIESVDDQQVIINYKQYALQQKGKPAPIGKRHFEGAKFLQQFAQHFMPRGFHRVRYYGFYSFSAKSLKATIHEQLSGQPPTPYQVPTKKVLVQKMLGRDIEVCTHCGSIGNFVTTPIPTAPRKMFKLTKRADTPIRAGPIHQKYQAMPLF